MAVPQVQKFDTLIRDALSGRVGLVFPVGQEPEDASGTLPHPVPEGANWAKYYLPAKGEFAKTNFAVYPVPAGVAHAPHGEIVFRKQGATVTFARHGEERAWDFGKEPYMRLRVNRNPDGGYDSFVPLYIRVNLGGDVSYYRLEVQWGGGDIAVYIDEVRERSVPSHLVKGSVR